VRRALPIVAAAMLAACATVPEGAPPLPRAEAVDLERFMGDWFVIAHAPTPPERDAFNAVERYALCGDGRVATVFRFRERGFDGQREILRPTGFPNAESGFAEWGMQFLWPFRAEYVVAWLDNDYQSTIIARSARDYVWLMHREPAMPPQAVEAALQRIADMGYERSALRMVPQRWPEADGSDGPGPRSQPRCD
jgi:apolipoprotein D and lipocalin family protein